MRAPVSFFNLFEEAVRLLFRAKPLLFMILPFGLILFFSLKVSEHLPAFLSEEFDPHIFLTLLLEQKEIIVSIFSLLILLGIIKVALRGPLFLMLERSLLKKLSSPTDFSPFHQKLFWRSASLSLLFETGYWLILLLLGLILFSPLVVASQFNPAVIPSLLQMGILFFITMAIIFFYIKEFGLLYTLLAHIKPRLSIELGLKLFKKHPVLSLLFGLFLIVLSFLFTFFLNLAIITSALIPFIWPRELVSLLSSIAILGFTSLLIDTLRLLFFHALAATPRLKIMEAKKVLEEEKSASGAPTV